MRRKRKKSRKKKWLIGLVDADLLDNGTRHPNLALLKIAGFLFDNKVKFELILNSNEDVEKYDHIYMSRVFTFTNLPDFYLKVRDDAVKSKKFHIGGTGFYAIEKNIKKFSELRCKDMNALEKDGFLNSFPNKKSNRRKKGIDMAQQMPYYHLYDKFIENEIAKGKNRNQYKDYLDYSIGFLTRGCVRHCPFCVNKIENKIRPYSELEWFLDQEKDENGKPKRPYIHLWDDNFLASDRSIWKPRLQKLIDLKIPFQFRQGLDERMLAQSEDGEEMSYMLSKAKYHGDFIFAFDNWRDRELVESALKIWKKYNPKKSTKFYLFCGFMLSPDSHERFYNDIWELFQRIRILMQYGCVGYVMRHENYHQCELPNIYVQIARWCNQQQFYKKMSFWEFVYRNQSYWEEKTLGIHGPIIKTYPEFVRDFRRGVYTDERQLCLPIRTFMNMLTRFPNHRDELLEMFNYKMENLFNPRLWEE